MSALSPKEQAILERAVAFARTHKKAIARELVDTSILPAEDRPVSVFMAGSPGAGKTETAEELVERFSHPILRIDADALRERFAEYNGANSHLFQHASTILVDCIHDLALKRKRSFILDSTFSHEEKALKNVERSLNKQRQVHIFYVYQDPVIAWNFVRARELTEGRRILKSTFIARYFNARSVVQRAKEKYQERVLLHVLIKNIDNSTRQRYVGVERIDDIIRESYTAEQLESLLPALEITQ